MSTEISDWGPVKSAKILYRRTEMDLGIDEILPLWIQCSFVQRGQSCFWAEYDKDGNEQSAILFNYDANGKLLSVSGREWC